MSLTALELVTTPATEATVTDRAGNTFLVTRIRWSACATRQGLWICDTTRYGSTPAAGRHQMLSKVIGAEEPLSWPLDAETPPEWFVTAAEALRESMARRDTGSDDDRVRRILGEQIREATARLDSLAGRPRDAAKGFLDGLRLARTLLDTDGSVR